MYIANRVETMTIAADNNNTGAARILMDIL